MNNLNILRFDNNVIISIFGGLLITIGLISSEASFSHKSIGFLSAIIFIVGWILYLFAQRNQNKLWLKGGIFIPIVAMMGQLYFMNVIKNIPFSMRKNSFYILVTILFWMVFMALWTYYGYNISLVKNEDDEEYVSNTRAFFVWFGIALLMCAMIGYFFYREFDWYLLTGGFIPSMNSSTVKFGIFNPFVSIIGFGWGLLSLAPHLDSSRHLK